MSDTYIKAAFDAVCPDAEQGTTRWVTLYIDLPFYGGPEEGGWWGSDTKLVASRQCSTEAEATALKEAIVKLAEELSVKAKDAFNRRCAAECEWLEARGLDDDFLPEVDGEERYWVAVEDRQGSFVKEGDRGYS